MGLSSIFVVDDVSATPVLVQTGRCAITGAMAVNTTGQAAYVQLFNAAAVSEVVLGTTRPDWAFTVAGNGVASDSGFPGDGVVFDRGLVIASTTANGGATGAPQHVRVCLGWS
jgi:hypothetical protein